MKKSKHYQEVLNLGKKISDEFSLEHGGITISWMGNYIADLILRAETEMDAGKKAKLEKECFDVILKLWRQREQLSIGYKPLREYKHVISVLKSLQQKEESFDWYSFESQDNIEPWGNFVEVLKKNYKDAMQIAVYAAASPKSLADGKEWLKHEKVLTKDEKLVIKLLDNLLTKRDSPFEFIVFENDKEKASSYSESRKMKVLNKLSELIELQNKALEILINRIQSSDFNTLEK